MGFVSSLGQKAVVVFEAALALASLGCQELRQKWFPSAFFWAMSSVLPYLSNGQSILTSAHAWFQSNQPVDSSCFTLGSFG